MRFAIFSDIHANLEALEAVLADARENKCTDFVCLGDVVGHTHVPMAFVRDDGVQRQRIDKLRVDSSKKYFINTGSVGQPRDSDWRAAYCIYHIEGAVVEQRRVKYDLATAQKKIIDAGLPRLLAERLAIGR